MKRFDVAARARGTAALEAALDATRVLAREIEDPDRESWDAALDARERALEQLARIVPELDPVVFGASLDELRDEGEALAAAFAAATEQARLELAQLQQGRRLTREFRGEAPIPRFVDHRA